VVAYTTGEGAAEASVCLVAWAHPATVVADTTSVGASLASVRLVGVRSGSHCCG
jgi:hypothetical protein